MKQTPIAARPVDLIEEAFHLLRLARGGALATYYLGTLPFVLGLLFFWADMAHNAFAEQRLIPGALGLSLLFLWMKCWQSLFAQQIHARLCGDDTPRLTSARLLRAASIQAIIQPSGLFLLPVALVLLLPFGWLYAFYSNVTVFAAAEDGSVKSVIRNSAKQALLWPLQNHAALLLFKLFSLFVFLNLLSAAFLLPYLLKSVLGIETAFTQSPLSLLNSTLMATLAGLTFLCVDPILKTVYVLRSFYGQSLRTGEDLKAEWKNVPATRKLILPLLLIGLATLSASSAEDPSRPSVAGQIVAKDLLNPAELDRVIDQVIQKREYSWRLPHSKSGGDKDRESLAKKIGHALKKWAIDLGIWIRDLVGWLKRYLRGGADRESAGFGVGEVVRSLLIVLIGLIGGILFWLLWRWWKRQVPLGPEIIAQPILPVPDLRDENVGASQMPEDGWLKLARELLERGELRLALRAFYFSSLAHLAERKLISLAQFKSNWDYQKELARRSQAPPTLAALFVQNVATFDRVWYGVHEVNQALLQQFAGNVERIKEC